MACTEIIQGYEQDCLDSVGGVEEVYVTEFTNVPQANITAASGTISALSCSGSNKFYTLQVGKNNASVEQKTISSPENGTQYQEQTITFNLKHMTAALRYTVKSLAKNRLMIIYKDRNGKIWLLGQTTGLDAGEINGTSGQQFGDLNGYTLTFVGMEADAASTMSQSVLDGVLS